VISGSLEKNILPLNYSTQMTSSRNKTSSRFNRDIIDMKQQPTQTIDNSFKLNNLSKNKER
jgi:hypothetical protein